MIASRSGPGSLDIEFKDWNLTCDGEEFVSRYRLQYLRDIDSKIPELVDGPKSGVSLAAVFDFLDCKFAELHELGQERVPWRRLPTD